jgi:hypothetical protein
MSKNAKRGLLAVGAALVLAYMIYLTMSPNTVTCEVCIEFRGATECRKATSQDRMEAEAAAASTACGSISGGITDGIECRNTTPKSVSCEGP